MGISTASESQKIEWRHKKIVGGHGENSIRAPMTLAKPCNSVGDFAKGELLNCKADDVTDADLATRWRDRV